MEVSLNLPREIYEILKEKAERLGKDIVEVIIDSVISSADPDEHVNIYVRLHKKYLEEANNFSKKGDFVQACKKYWGAITALLNAIGEIKNLPHYSHRDYSEMIEKIAEELNDPSLSSLFASAERMHANFYHNFLKKATFEELRRNVLKLIEKLESYVLSLIKN